MNGPSEALVAAFAARVEPEPNSGCWLWAGSWSDLDYGMFASARRHGQDEIMAHRIAWRLSNGPVPTGLKVLHRCDVRACVNPAHLFLGTQADNIADMDAKGRRRTRGLSGEQNPQARLSKAGVRAMRAAYSSGVSQHALAKTYGVAVMTVNRAVRRLSWVAA